MDGIVNKVMVYFNDYLFPPGREWTKYYKLERSYERWAASYLIRRLLDNRDKPGISVIEDTALYFQNAARSTTVKEQRHLFAVAADTVTDILETIKKEK